MEYKIHKRQTEWIKGKAFTMCGSHDSEVKNITNRWDKVTCKNCLRCKND